MWIKKKDYPQWYLSLPTGWRINLTEHADSWFLTCMSLGFYKTKLCEGVHLPLIKAQEAALTLVQMALIDTSRVVTEAQEQMDRDELEFAVNQLSRHDVWSEFLDFGRARKNTYPLVQNTKALANSLRFFCAKKDSAMPFGWDAPLSEHVSWAFKVFDGIMLEQMNRT